jgi:uncharacterized membrane protein YedE/YeeE
MIRGVAAAAAAAAILGGAYGLYGTGTTRERERSFTVLAGAAFGFVLQRSRFCMASAFRDLFLAADRRRALGLLAALAAGTVGYAVIFGAWVPDPSGGYVPRQTHVAPAGWHLLVGGTAFGIGMVLAGGCISGQLYRLGEGSLAAPVALAGTLAGFMAGFASWNFFYLRSAATAPVVWLPQKLGYAGALALQLGALAALAAFLLRKFPAPPPRTPEPAGLTGVLRRTFRDGWPAAMGGAAIGLLAMIVYLRTVPLGVTSQIGTLARWAGGRLGVVPDRLLGLDGLPGCRAVVGDTLLTDNGLFVLALVGGSLLGALLAGEFRPRAPRPRTCLLALAGGALAGFGAMISLGCTVGTLLSGTMAMSLSGWVFAAGLLGGSWAGTAILRRLA